MPIFQALHSAKWVHDRLIAGDEGLHPEQWSACTRNSLHVTVR